MSTKNSTLSRRWQRARYAGSVIVILTLALVAFFTSMHSVTHAQSGDWPTYLGNNAHTGYNAAETIINPSTASKLKIHWRHKYSAKISTQPIVANSTLYWGSYDGIEHASSLTNGADIWTANLGLTTDCRKHTQGVLSTATVATVTIQGNPTTVVFVGGGDNNLYALDANTGTVLWKTLLGSSSAYFMYSSPTVYNGSVYIGVSAAEDCLHVVGQMVQLDTSTGIIQHIFNTVPTGCLGGSVWTSPTIDESTGILYFSTGEKSACKQHETMVDSLIALNAANLSLLGSWQVPASEIIMDGDFGSSPTLFQATISGTPHQMVGLANKNGIYYAFDRSNISAGPLWEMRLATTPGPTISSSAWDGTDLYVSAGTTTLNGANCAGSLSALDPATGTPLWRDCLPFDAFAPVTAVPGLAELADDNDIRIVDVTTGNLLFDYHQKTNFLGPGTISNGILYQADMGGDMYAFGL
ncbi:MAG: PQQ-binding-like beta-propeller repeat protein [Ktedonobacteraceae bacterium]